MGFPGNYSDIELPRFLLRSLLLLGYIRSLVCWLFRAVGLEDILNSEDSSWLQDNNHSYNYSQEMLNFSSFSAKKIQDSLPVMNYEELVTEAGNSHLVGDCCSVCLCEFESKDEVRRLSNCRHIFHRGCLDRWTEQEQCTCPLCRTPLVDGITVKLNCFDNLMQSASEDGGVDYYYNEDDLYSFFTLTRSSSLMLPQPRTSALLLSTQFL